MNKNIDLLAIGNPCADLVIRTTRTPGWDDKCAGASAGTYAGGTEANVACAASRLGLAVAVYGEVGDDGHAGFLLDDFKRFGVDTDWMLRRERAASAMTIIMVSPEGERAIVWVPMTPRDRPVEDLKAALARSRIAYTMPYDEAALAALSTMAHEADAQLAIDVEREGAGGLHRLLQHCDIAFMNETGFTTATGEAPNEAGLRALHAASKAHTVVVTIGARGALGISDQGFAQQPSFPAKVLDATGAGDTFNAAFLVGRLQGMGLQQAMALGCAAAGKTVEALGARSGMPTRDETLAVVAAGSGLALSRWPAMGPTLGSVS